ncbi:expressed protein [Phakopsora pachyrhizi]|uniref:Expressed protein n=1 Tax=Phakopsora pachyrhizi TaxID=170000 RepID=A0AAV0BB92_PHAPC|nr:expressed protein [Phakopsora pachyrhizi]
MAWGDWKTLMDCISVVCKLIPNAGTGGSWNIGLVEEKDQSNQEYSGKTCSGLKIPLQEIGASKLQQDARMIQLLKSTKGDFLEARSRWWNEVPHARVAKGRKGLLVYFWN